MNPCISSADSLSFLFLSYLGNSSVIAVFILLSIWFGSELFIKLYITSCEVRSPFSEYLGPLLPKTPLFQVFQAKHPPDTFQVPFSSISQQSVAQIRSRARQYRLN